MRTTEWIDTHCHLDGTEFDNDREEVIQKARQAGVGMVFVPAIDYDTSGKSLSLANKYPDYIRPMFGLHPEEVRADWSLQLERIWKLYLDSRSKTPDATSTSASQFIAIGEVGLDFYWSREFEQEQIEAFETQVRWSAETSLPLMIHCRKAQNEMVKIIKRYARELPGGVFHCFTGNEHEATELLQFEQFVLGIGGVLTFKKSNLPEVLPKAVPLERIVIETDAPYMAPVPMRGQRNEPAFTSYVVQKLAECYGVSTDVVARQTTENARRVFKKL